jgi:peptide methionine sulfoxide reductase MsrB
MPSYGKDAGAISRLSPEQFRVTQHSATERPFENAYWDHTEPGAFTSISFRASRYSLRSTNLIATVAGQASRNQLILKM